MHVLLNCSVPSLFLDHLLSALHCRAGVAASAGRGKPVPRAHVDYTLTSGPGRLKELLPEEAESLQKTPYAVIQVQCHGLTLKQFQLNQYKHCCVCSTTCIACQGKVDHDMKLKRMQAACAALTQTTAITSASLPRQLRFISLYAIVK